MDKKTFDEIFERYTAAVTATDVDAILRLYARNASIEIPVGGPLATGIDAIETFYRDNELAESLRVVGPVCVAGCEAAVPMRARVRRDGVLTELDVIDVARIDAAGQLLSMRAFFDLEGGRIVEEH
jgi:steroid delta-isomerase